MKRTETKVSPRQGMVRSFLVTTSAESGKTSVLFVDLFERCISKEAYSLKEHAV